MLTEITRRLRIVTTIWMAIGLQVQSTVAENRIELKRGSDNSISIELTNANSVEGFQFSLQARGGVVWGLYEGSERTSAAGLAIYQFLADDSTLNVIMLAPGRSPLPFGHGSIGRVCFTLRSGRGSDTISVFLSRLVICDAEARRLDVCSEQLTWNRSDSQDLKAAVFTLDQNYPNPFNPSTTIAYTLERPAHVLLKIYDIAGRLMSGLVDEFQNEGRHAITWNANGSSGSLLPSGMYFARLQVDDRIAIKKMILVK